MAGSDRIQTGITGLDNILHDGIPRTNVILVQGTSGSGKTLLGIEFIYKGITLFNEPGIIVIFETSPDKLIRDTAQFGWDLRELQTQKKLQIIFTTPQVLAQEMRTADSLLLETAVEMGAQRIFIDGIGLLRKSGPGDLSAHGSGPGSYREALQQLIEGLNRENLTTMFSHEIGLSLEATQSLESAVYLTDTVIELSRRRSGRRVQRRIEIIKSRGQSFDEGEHTLGIVEGKGLQVFRRVQSPPSAALIQPTSIAKRSAIGVDALDSMIGGGIY